MRRLIGLAVVVIGLSLGAMAQAPKISPDLELPLSAEQTAQAMGLQPLFEKLKDLSSRPDMANTVEMLWLQQRILLQVTSVSLQVDAASDQIEVEVAETRELENDMSGRRDAKVNRLNLAALGIGGTLGTASSALGFTVHDNAAALTGVLGGVATVALSVAALKAANGPKQELMVQSNMLSKVFDHPSDANNVYPLTVVAFMDAIAPDDPDGLSRQDRLIRGWVEGGRIPDPDTAKGKEKINRVTSLPGQRVKQTIADLEDRQAMLFDLRVRLNYMKQDLAILLASVQEAVPEPQPTVH
jgi:hypothetical protein